MAVGKYSLSNFFVGQGDLILFGEVADYTSAKVSTLPDPTSLGDIKLDSTEWSGEDISTNNIQNEQGEIIASTSVSGTYAFNATVMSTDPERLAELMKAVSITDTGATSSSWIDASTGNIVGIGDELPIIERPIAIVNDTLNQVLLFPRAKITTTIAIEDKLTGLSMSVVAQKVSTDDLKTVMIINGAVQY